MNRRALLMMSAATAVSVALPQSAQAVTTIPFSPATWEQLSQTDETVILNFRASWSLTCQIKLDLIAKLLAENPVYADLTFVDINWDTYGQSILSEKMRIKRRSTLVVMKQGQEIARVENEPYERKIRALLDAAVAA